MTTSTHDYWIICFCFIVLLANSRWANRYGWALMLQIVSNDTFENSKHKLTLSDHHQHTTGVKPLHSYGNSIYLGQILSTSSDGN